jgi:hypothetical protein
MSFTYSSTRRVGATLIAPPAGGTTGYAFVNSPVANAKINTCITL